MSIGIHKLRQKTLWRTCIVSDKPLSALENLWKTAFWRFKRQWTRNIWIVSPGILRSLKIKREMLSQTNLTNPPFLPPLPRRPPKNLQDHPREFAKPRGLMSPLFLIFTITIFLKKILFDKCGVLNTSGVGSENSSSHQSDFAISKTNHKSQWNNIVNLSTYIQEPG